MVLLFLGNWRTHADHRADHPAVDPRLHHRAAAPRRDAQPDDAGRARAVGGHPGRPGDRHHREHRAAPAHGHAAARRRSSVGAGEIGVPAFVSTLCICIVFVPMFFLSGVARFLFVPMAEAVVFAMIASYFLSRTLVPTLVMLLMSRAQPHDDARLSLLQRALPPLRPPLRARAARLHARAVGPARASARLRARLPRLHAAVVPAVPVPRPRLLPERGCRADPPAHARCDRHAHRGDGTPRRRGRSRRSARSCRPTSSRRSSTTSACPTAASTCRTATREPSARSTARSCCRCKPGHRPTDEFVTRAARGAAQALSRRRVLLPAGGHHHADPEFRPAGGHRRAVHRQQPARERACSPRRSRGRSSRFPAPSTRTCTSAWTCPRSTCRWIARGCSSSASPRSTSARTC